MCVFEFFNVVERVFETILKNVNAINLKIVLNILMYIHITKIIELKM